MPGQERFPLGREGDGWFELVDPEPGVVYAAYRVVCTDPECPSAWPPATHSHIEEQDAG